MATDTTISTAGPATFPTREVERRLRRGLKDATADSKVLRGGWEPVLDSLRMVSVVLTLEDLFPFELPPERLVRQGGYGSVDEGVEDMTRRMQRLWQQQKART